MKETFISFKEEKADDDKIPRGFEKYFPDDVILLTQTCHAWALMAKTEHFIRREQQLN